MASKIRNGFTKYILPETKSDILPQQIAWRRDKTGYETPQKKFLRDEAKKISSYTNIKPCGLSKEIEPRDAFDADNFDWQFLIATKFI